MITNVFSIFDTKTGLYMQPFYMRTQGEAMRALMSVMQDVNHNFAKYPSDFVLFRLGTYDESSACFEMLNAPHSVCGLIELVAQQQQLPS